MKMKEKILLGGILSVFISSLACANPCLEIHVPLRSLDDVSQVVVREQTGDFTLTFFDIESPSLAFETVDLTTSANEIYDFYISDENGNYTPDGSYITSACNRSSRYGNQACGHNLDAIYLTKTDGSKIYADLVASYVKGYLPYNEGYAENVLGSPDGKITYLGDDYSRITVGFCSITHQSTTVPDVASPVVDCAALLIPVFAYAVVRRKIKIVRCQSMA
jgi:hypothetical protein